MRKAFTLLELILAVTLVGVMTAVATLTFRAVTNGWRVSREYMDRLERTDYAIDQLVSGLKCCYYPHTGSQNGEYGFFLTDNGDGDSPRDSDTIEWTKLGSAMVGSSARGDTVHRIQVMVLEEGNDDWGERVERTGLYARVMPHAKVITDETEDEKEFTFASDEYYRPILIAKDVEGFNCRVMKKAPEGGDQKVDKSDWEDEFPESNSVPYKVQLTFYIEKEDPEYRSQKKRIPLLRSITLPVHEQSLDGAALPGDETSSKGGGSKKK